MAVIALAQRDYLDETEGEANENRRAAAARTTLRAQLERGLQVKKFGRSGNARPKLLYLAPSTDATRGARLVWRNMPMSPSKRHPVAPTGRDANRKAVPLVGARVVRAAVPRSDGCPSPRATCGAAFNSACARARLESRGQTDACSTRSCSRSTPRTAKRADACIDPRILTCARGTASGLSAIHGKATGSSAPLERPPRLLKSTRKSTVIRIRIPPAIRPNLRVQAGRRAHE